MGCRKVKITKFTMLEITSLAATLLLSTATLAQQCPSDPAQAFDTYVAKTQAQRDAVTSYKMYMQMSASNSSGDKTAHFSGLRTFDSKAGVLIEAKESTGNETIQNWVIGKAISSDIEISQMVLKYQAKHHGEHPIETARNHYNVIVKGLESDGLVKASLFHYYLVPIKPSKGLFEGDLWISAKTCLPVNEKGRVVGISWPGSMIVKEIRFERIYEAINPDFVYVRQVKSLTTSKFGDYLSELIYSAPFDVVRANKISH